MTVFRLDLRRQSDRRRRGRCSRAPLGLTALWLTSLRLASFCVSAALLLPLAAQAQIAPGLSGLTGANAKGYLSPLPKALSSVLNTSIFQSGYVPKTGVNVQVGASLMSVQFDDADRVYTASYPGPSELESAEVPTVIGDLNAKHFSGPAGTEQYFSGGFDLKDFSVGVPQISIGSFMGTRLTARWIAVKLGDKSEELGDLELFGIGGQHSISQYFSGLPVDVALGGFYQTFKLGQDLVDTKALHVDLTASKSFSVLQPYAAIGYDSFDMDLSYNITNGNETVDKIAVKFDQETNLHLTAGLQANLAIVRAHIEYNLAAENAVAFGLSLGN